jgi:hypothetical protein
MTGKKGERIHVHSSNESESVHQATVAAKGVDSRQDHDGGGAESKIARSGAGCD